MLAGNVFYFEWEIALIRLIQSHFGAFGILLSKFLSLLGQEYPLVAIVMIFYFSGNKTLGKRLCINLMSVLIWAPMIKNVFFRIRPYFAHKDIEILIPPSPTEDAYDMLAQGYSFPSAHSACSTAAYPFVGKVLNKKWTKILGLALPILIGVSRFCVGAHYPTDVLAGWAIGAIVLMLLPFLYSKIKNENVVNFIILATGIPGLFYCQTEDFFSGFALLLGACFGFWFEQKYVKFSETRNIKYIIVRIVLGIGVFLLFAQGLKFVLGTSILVRVIRYSIGSFITLGLYPMLFKRIEKSEDK